MTQLVQIRARGRSPAIRDRRDESAVSAKSHAPWSDADDRVIRYIRLSLTDRCNYRCTYCRPAEGLEFGRREDVLSFDEIERLMRAFARRGVRRIRLTGGEPTVRRDLPDLIARLKSIRTDDGRQLAVVLTTNGELLAEFAASLAQAGLDGLTVSIDSLQTARFEMITRGGRLDRVLAGIEAARKSGLQQIKLNTVAVKGFNDDELGALATFAFERQLVPRFIELMPMSGGELYVPGSLMMASEIRAAIGKFCGADSVVADEASDVRGLGPATYWRLQGGRFTGGRFGVIAAMTENFCASCNRLRISATGQIHACLANDDAGDLRTALRNGTIDDVESIVSRVLRGKRSSHQFQLDGSGGPNKAMISIGG